MENKEYKEIKKLYGEQFAKMCRDFFPTILETEGVLTSLVKNSFHPSKDLYQDIIDSNCQNSFKNYILNKNNKQRTLEEHQTNIANEKPAELMKKAGYSLFKCESKEDVERFKKYWAPNEELCTFRDTNRINTNLIFFAVKDSVDKIIRSDFNKPRRQDAYGTSVISIQFTKAQPNTISIKNRYNHAVECPDSTFSNDLENIYAGLTDSFIKEYNLNLVATEKSFELPGYVMANDKLFYKYNSEINNIYFCPNNITITNGDVVEYNKSRYLLFDNYLLDMHEKKIIYLADKSESDAFADTLQNINKITTTVKNDKKKLSFATSEGQSEILLNKQNQIIGYKNENVTTVGDGFLFYNKSLKEIDLPKLTTIGDVFLYRNTSLTELDLPKLTTVGYRFLYWNTSLTALSAPELTTVKDSFLDNNQSLTELNLPGLTTVRYNFLYCNQSLTELNLPKLTEVGGYFLHYNTTLTALAAPELTTAGDSFLENNLSLTKLNLPELTEVGDRFLDENKSLTELNLPKLTTVGYRFLGNNQSLTKLNLPELREAGDSFLKNNQSLTKLNLPELREVGDCFLDNNQSLTKLNLPELREVGDRFLGENKSLTGVKTPSVRRR